MLVALTLFAVHALDGKPSFEILGESLREKEIYARLASPDAQNVLGAIASARSNAPAYLFLGDQASQVSPPDRRMTEYVCLDNSGLLLANADFSEWTYNFHGFTRRAFFYKSGRITWIVDHPEWTSSYIATGVGRDNKILANEIPAYVRGAQPKPRSWLSAGSQLVFAQSLGLAFQDKIIAETPMGFVGQIVTPPANGVSGQCNVRVAYFRGERVELMEVPRGFNQSEVLASTLDGETVAGLVDGLAAIWRKGKLINIPQKPAERKLVSICSLCEDGSLGVGGHNRFKSDLAVVWREKEGIQSLASYLAEKKVKVPEGWSLIDAITITRDGSTIVGSAKNSAGIVRPFRLTLRATEKVPAESTGGG